MSTGVDLIRAGSNLLAARQRLDKAMDSARQAAIAAHAEGVTEVELSRLLGVNRMTVRRWLGKL